MAQRVAPGELCQPERDPDSESVSQLLLPVFRSRLAQAPRSAAEAISGPRAYGTRRDRDFLGDAARGTAAVFQVLTGFERFLPALRADERVLFAALGSAVKQADRLLMSLASIRRLLCGSKKLPCWDRA